MTLFSFQDISPTLADRVFVSSQSSVIGHVTLGHDTSVWPFASIRGDLLPIEIGCGTNIQDHACLHTTAPNALSPKGHALRIGQHVTIGHHATLHGCQIDDFVLIGIGAIVLDGVYIPEDVMVAAGCVVPPGKNLESGYIYVGNPARKHRALSETEKEHIRHNARSYIKQKNIYLGI